MADKVHILRINSTIADLTTNLDALQTAIATDDNSNGYKPYCWKDAAGNMYQSAAVGEDAGFDTITALGDIELDGDLIFYGDGGGSNIFSTSVAQTADVTYTLPTDYPAASGYYLTCSEAGVLTWTTGTGIGSVSSPHIPYSSGASTLSDTTMHWDNSYGRLGVGTASPDALLTVNGVGSFGAGSASLPSIAATGDLNTGWWFPSADTIAASTGGTERVRVASGGMTLASLADAAVGYVKASTAGLLSRQTGVPYSDLTSVPSTFTPALHALDSTTYHSGGSLTHKYVPYFATDKLANSPIATDGTNVGIGTTSPAAQLEIYGAPSISGDARATLFASDNSAYTEGVGGGIGFCGRIDSSNDRYIFGSIKGYKASGVLSNYAGQLHFQTRSTGGLPSTRMVIDHNGNVGIGTANPSNAKLQFDNGTGNKITFYDDGTSTHGIDFQTGTLREFVGGSTDTIAFGYKTSGTYNGWVVIKAGNVGIGTAEPDALLTVNGVCAVGDGAVGAPALANTGDLNTGLWFPAADTIAISTAGSERMRIDSSGNVGIGKSPSYKLDVSGAINASGNVCTSSNFVVGNLYAATDGISTSSSTMTLQGDPINITKYNSKSFLCIRETSLGDDAHVDLDTLLGSPFGTDTMRGILIVNVTASAGYFNVGIFAICHDGMNPSTVKIADAGNCASSDTDGKLCVYHDGSDFIIKNRLGGVYTVSATFIGSYAA